MIRALHVFPLFGADLPNGSERYAWALTHALVDLGVEVDVYATCSRSVRQKSGFTLNWPHDLDAGRTEIRAGLSLRRFSTITMPAWAGWLAARLLDRHVDYARRTLGAAPEPTAGLAAYQHRVMATQGWACAALMLLCLGPVSPGLYWNVWRKAASYDVILVSFFPLLSIPVVAQGARAPVVALPLFHANDLSNNSRILGRAVEKARAVLSLTPHSAAYLKQIYPQCQPVEVGAGIDSGAFGDAISGDRFRHKFHLAGRNIVLCVGRKEAGKRYRVAMEAMRWVADPQAILILAGEDVDQLPVSGDRVRYLGRLSQCDLWDAYEACDVLVLASRFESFGLVFIEAWSRGKPVIGDSGCPAVASLIEDSVDGFLCADAREIAERLNRLLADPHLRARMGERGKRKVLAKYTWAAVAGKVRDTYQKLIDEAS